MAAFASSDSEQVREAFDAADTDDSGTLDAKELQVVIETLELSMTVEEIEHEIGADAHNNGDGELSIDGIDFETFSLWWKKHESSPRVGIVYTGYVRLYSSC